MHALHAVDTCGLSFSLGHAIHVHRTFGHLAQEGHVLGSEDLFGPECGESGDGIEGFNAADAGAGFVVIAADELSTEFARGVGDFVGTAAVSDDVAQIDDGIVRGCGLEAGLHALQVGMDVADDEDAQSRPTGATLLNQGSNFLATRNYIPLSRSYSGCQWFFIASFARRSPASAAALPGSSISADWNAFIAPE